MKRWFIFYLRNAPHGARSGGFPFFVLWVPPVPPFLNTCIIDLNVQRKILVNVFVTFLQDAEHFCVNVML
jgi:hypothetical protein